VYRIELFSTEDKETCAPEINPLATWPLPLPSF
jgi:hypothetical protein